MNIDSAPRRGHWISVAAQVCQQRLSYNYQGLRFYTTVVDQNRLRQMRQWCHTCVGTDNWNYYGQFQATPFEFRFRYAEDLSAFRLMFGP